MMIRRMKLALAVLVGKTTMPAGRSITVQPDDLFIVSYPRSGNTWMRFLVGNLIDAENPVSFANIERRVPDIHQSDDQHLLQLPRPRVLKSHEYFDPQYRRVINIVRDPRDVAVSYYHYQIKIRRIDEGYPINEFVSRFVAGEVDRFGSWGEHVGSWLGARQGSAGFHLLRYEDLLEEPVGQLERIAAFLSIDCTAEHLNHVVRLSSADRMRQLERSQTQSWEPMKKSRTDKPFVRSASAGQWSALLSPSAAQAIEDAWQTQMELLGYLR